MIKVSELWIGDLLLLKKSGRIGKFAGISADQKVKVKLENKIIITTPGNIEYAPESKSGPEAIIKKPSISFQKTPTFSDTIDLHIEILNPSLLTARPERIIDYQIKQAKVFIEAAIENNAHKIEIIHGKGQGVLKSEVLHLLNLFDEVNFIFDKNDGGSTEVLLK